MKVIFPDLEKRLESQMEYSMQNQKYHKWRGNDRFFIVIYMLCQKNKCSYIKTAINYISFITCRN